MISALLSSTGGGLDQPTPSNRIRNTYICRGCIISSWVIIFPGNYRFGAPMFAFLGAIVMNLLQRGAYRSIRQGPR
jgi:hypothetical protein